MPSTQFVVMSTDYITEPGTEHNLRLHRDATPFSPGELSDPHPVLVDGILGLASIGSHGAYSERIYVEIKSIVEMCVVYVEENVAVLSLFSSTKSSFSHRGTTGKEYSYAEQEYDFSLCTKRDDENPNE